MKTVQRDEGLVAALSLPTLSLYNMRSVWAKLDNLADDITMRETDICFLTEVWQKQENKKHNYSIEKMLEMKGIFYISTPRPGARRGGGVAMAFPKTNFQVTKGRVQKKKTPFYPPLVDKGGGGAPTVDKDGGGRGCPAVDKKSH